MRLNQFSDFKNAKKVRKRVGRGVGSGSGKTCGSGQKGQKSRTGVALGGFEGGQMPLYRRLPKRGFVRLKSKDEAFLNIGDLQYFVDKGRLDPTQVITLDVLKKQNIVSPLIQNLKLLAKGTLKVSLKIEIKKISDAAKNMVECLGGSILYV
jgi:large subunit ribosomal protein L15